MRSFNRTVKRVSSGVVFLALFFCHVPGPRAAFSPIQVPRLLEGLSVTHAKACEHEKSQDKSKGTKKQSQILSGHRPEKLVESCHSTLGPISICVDFDPGASERLDSREDLTQSSPTYFLMPPTRASPLSL
jgi:hypothetical protein